MKHITAMSMLVILVIIQSAQGNWEHPGAPKCKCLKQTISAIKRPTIKQIEIFPAESYCPKIEILITLKKGGIVCVNPGAKWLKNVLKSLMAKKTSGQNPLVLETAYPAQKDVKMLG
ncbi:hypothetical protein FKM82_000910 [Ascaphus truei]